MLKIIKILKYAMFALPMIFQFNFFQYTMEFFTFGLTNQDPFVGDYALITLAFSICFYTFFIIDAMANKVKEDVIADTIAYYIRERKKGVPVDQVEAKIKKMLYKKYKPEKTQFIYKDVIISICESLEKPLTAQETYKGDIYERAKSIDADGAVRATGSDKEVEEDHTKPAGGSTGTDKTINQQHREPNTSTVNKDTDIIIKDLKGGNNGSNIAINKQENNTNLTKKK